MTVGIDDGKFILKDNWPGPVVQVPYPEDLTEVYANEAAALCPLGTKIAIYQPTNHDYAIFKLLQYAKGTAVAAGIKSFCVSRYDGSRGGRRQQHRDE